MPPSIFKNQTCPCPTLELLARYAKDHVLDNLWEKPLHSTFLSCIDLLARTIFFLTLRLLARVATFLFDAAQCCVHLLLACVDLLVWLSKLAVEGAAGAFGTALEWLCEVQCRVVLAGRDLKDREKEKVARAWAAAVEKFPWLERAGRSRELSDLVESWVPEISGFILVVAILWLVFWVRRR